MYYKTIYLRVQRPQEALDAPLLHLERPVEIDEVYVKAGLKGRERDQPSRSRGLSTRGRGTYDKPHKIHHKIRETYTMTECRSRLDR